MTKRLLLLMVSMCLISPLSEAGILRLAYKGTKAVVKTSAKVVGKTAKVTYKIVY